MTELPNQSDLSKRMRAIADREGLPADHPMRVRADEFDSAVIEFNKMPKTSRIGPMVGAWARARRAYCNHTGEPLI